MKHLLNTVALLLAFAGSTYAQTDRFVTLVCKAQGNAIVTNSVTISEAETATVVSLFALYSTSTITVSKNDANYSTANLGLPITVKGPAKFTLSSQSYDGFATLRISPESFDPNKTLILPPSTNQVSVALETSTNLVNWSTATNGIFGSPDEARFFRIHMQTQ